MVGGGGHVRLRFALDPRLLSDDAAPAQFWTQFWPGLSGGFTRDRRRFFPFSFFLFFPNCAITGYLFHSQI